MAINLTIKYENKFTWISLEEEQHIKVNMEVEHKYNIL